MTYLGGGGFVLQRLKQGCVRHSVEFRRTHIELTLQIEPELRIAAKVAA